MDRRVPVVALAAVTALVLLPAADGRAAAPLDPGRSVEPVVLTGASIPTWSRLPAVGLPNPDPQSGRAAPFGDASRDAHNGTLHVPPDSRVGVPVGQITGWRADGSSFRRIPVQVDQRFPWFLANGPSAFSHYSGTDQELTYQWDVERWKMTGGSCVQDPAEGVPMLDPVETLDDDDEIVFMASDAGARATELPDGWQEVELRDAVSATSSYVYLSLSEQPAHHKPYVKYERDANADEWIDEASFADSDPEKLGSSNHEYGPNLAGDVCDPDGAVRASTDRFVRDGVSVRTDRYAWRATGRWMIRSLQIASGRGSSYGPDLIDRWKGRAYQSSPDAAVRAIDFEDEQVNWEANSTLLGERVGPVRAIREVWGADSATNLTLTEVFYRDVIQYRYRVRVHPIPPDGLYTNWDHNAGVATTYFNALHPEGVKIDGVNDDIGNIDDVGGQPAFYDVPDPRLDVPLGTLRWEQVAGAGSAGSIVYLFETKGATSYENPMIVPFYRDDACYDDGTGDDPVPRPWPGTPSSDPLVTAGYAPGATCEAHQTQGSFGATGLHFLFVGDSDNAIFGTAGPLTEVDVQQWQIAVPQTTPKAVGETYAKVVRTPLVARVTSGTS